MNKIIIILPVVFFVSLSNANAASKKLSERLVTMNTKIDFDEAYNKALDEMQELNDAEKAKLSKELGAILLKDKSTERRANAASALGDICGVVKTNTDFFAKSFSDKEKVVRQATASGLKRCGATNPAVVPTLKKMLNDKDKVVQAMVQATLEEFGAK